MKKESFILGSDHAGFDMKEKVKKYFESKNISYKDYSPRKIEGDDYPEIAFKVGKEVARGIKKGILFCGSGTGMAIAANKVNGIRAVNAYDKFSARTSREDNNSNVLSLRARDIKFKEVKEIIDTWMKSSYSGKERHSRRIREIERYEANNG